MAPNLVVTIEETPARELWSNTRIFIKKKIPYVHAARESASLAAFNSLGQNDWRHAGPIHLDVVIAWPLKQRHLDFDNAVHALKSYTDGVFDRLTANDKQVVSMKVRQTNTQHPYIRYIITPITAGDTDET
jgi:Holliday junction resolvase RusA-like endonuclease